MKEIGSEFWEHTSEIKEKETNELTLLSGRTALDFIIRDIKKMQEFTSVILPSFCCDSMIEPFIRNGVNVSFYSVNLNGIDYSKNNADAVLVIDFFGFYNSNMTEIARVSKHNGQIVIYDSTHYLNERKIEADYVFCSYRKWIYCNFATVKKNYGSWMISAPERINENYIVLRNKAASLKEQYIHNTHENKQIFLQLFTEAEEILEQDYVDYAGKQTEIDRRLIIEHRKKNAQRLIDGICNIKEITIWKKQIDQKDTPLVVPIFVSTNIRNELRYYLIDNSIYCPIHWPLTKLHGDERALFDNEISLICDQRYSDEDISREIEVINRFFEERKQRCL